MSAGGGLGGMALASLLQNDQLLAESHTSTQTLHHPPKAKRVVQLYMSGAASQCDTFDYKPQLIKDNGNDWDPGEQVQLFQSSPGKTMQAPWKWKQYGQSGKWLNECVAPLGDCVDDMAFIHNMVSKSNVHGPATFMQATGFILPGFPGMGAWVSYGLGSMTDNLPTFVVLPDPRGFAPNSAANWSAGFLPANNQGTMIRPNSKTPISNLFPPENDFITRKSDRDVLTALKQLNQKHVQDRDGDSRLNARIQSYELAAKMQLQAPEVLDLSGETKSTLQMYGLDTVDFEVQEGISEAAEIAYFGRNCLVARRMLEQGVRFVQIWSGADNGHPRRNWDSHEDIERDHGPLARGMAVGTAALLKDLKRTGMLEDTIVLWTTEFGRMPSTQGSKGRDHNPYVFTNWMCGGGIRGGVTHGESDPWGYKPLDRLNPTQVYDIHATILHQLGIDHKRLTVRHDGVDRRLTDVHGHVIGDLI